MRGGGDGDRARLGRLLHARGEIHGVADGLVVHSEVVADGADDHGASIDADPHAKLDVLFPDEAVAERLDLPLHRERRQDRALRSILYRQRSPEEGDDAVARELVDRALVAMDLVDEELKELIHEGE